MAKKAELAIYPGTFDPITYGHIDIIKRALKVFEKVIITVGDNPAKKPLFSTGQRKEMIKDAVSGMNVEVDSFSGLLVDYAKKRKCEILVRSLRAVSDFDYEFQMSVMNRQLDSDIETVFLMTDKEYFYLNSSIVKEIAMARAKLSSLVPKNVEKKLMEKFR